ncbi:DUF7127 family protein [Halomarina ordinaria]|uniref:Hsp20/alpha crystallin family protein n=1 Tax=Halomarina ordinaria TaxID=3033939 RepID=A0ABD5UB18_9EURY|nr:hypothetical protein [Halomarina sp. PSRA2]
MSHEQRFVAEDSPVRRYDYDDAVVFAADLGDGRDVDVDVVDGTAIVVVASDAHDSRQFEFDLPDGDAQAFIKNGVVTVEVRA